MSGGEPSSIKRFFPCAAVNRSIRAIQYAGCFDNFSLNEVFVWHIRLYTENTVLPYFQMS